MTTISPNQIAPAAELFTGDALSKLDLVPDASCALVVTSPPYNIGKEYERDRRLSLSEYLEWLAPIMAKLSSKLTPDGSICWQSGNFVEDGEIFPLDIFFYDILKKLDLKLRNRIIWHYNFGLHAQSRFSGRYETILWFTKSDTYKFNLDPIRVPQLYPGKRHSAGKGDRAGQPSGNPKGKNPSDLWVFEPQEAFFGHPLWDVPNVKAKHPEKTDHPCQFPSELVERCVLALTDQGDTVLDPFVGSGTTAIAAVKHGRRAIGIDRDQTYIGIAQERLDLLAREELPLRPLGKPTRTPRAGERVSQMPEEWLSPREEGSSDGAEQIDPS